MKTFKSIHAWNDFKKHINSSLGFVPTMGCLHEGHLSLICKSQNENQHSLVSIYLNPTQFNSQDDLDKYPSRIDEDIQALERLGVDYLLLPQYDEIYADSYSNKISESDLSNELCGEYRPGHFDGVLTVVMKLLNIASADRAYFGEKDYQQYLLIKKMAESFFHPTEIISAPIVREESGLALSSRNNRLSEEALDIAPYIFKSISDKSVSLEKIKEQLSRKGIEVEYLTEKYNRRFIAAKLENIRLIDNVQL